MTRSVTADEALRDFSALLAAAEAGETVEIVRAGKPVAVLAPAPAAAPAPSSGTGLRSRGFRNR